MQQEQIRKKIKNDKKIRTKKKCANKKQKK